MPIPFAFDFKKPDYPAVFQWRYDRLCKIRKKPSVLLGMFQHYSEHPGQFIIDWGMTFDPRNVEVGLPAYCPFILFPRQEEAIAWIIERWKNREPGLADKSREMGMSWLTIALACTMCLFHDGFSMGFGSRKQEYVDKLGDLKAILPKARMFMSLLPPEFRRGWTLRDAPHMRIQFPETQSFISGESGDGIGRGDRVSIYVVDEAAWLPRPQLIEQSLSNTTNCRIDVSTPRGMANPFGKKRFGGKINVFSMHWAQPLDAKIVTPSGYRSMGGLSIGDLVIGSNGKSAKVLGVYPQGEKEVFRVHFSDGSYTECCDDHLWAIINVGDQREERRHIRAIKPLSSLRYDYVARDSRGYKVHRYQIPLISSPVEFASETLPLDAYVIGCILGDGSAPKKSSTSVKLINSDVELIALINAVLPIGCFLYHDGDIVYRFSVDDSYRGGTKGRGWHNPVNQAMRTLGLSGSRCYTKFIPDVYKFASPEDRLSLLQGLLDTDGSLCASDPGIGRFYSTSTCLISDVVFVVQSLGGTAKVSVNPAVRRTFPGDRTYDCVESYTVHIKLPNGLIPFRLSRKVSGYKPSSKYKPRRSIVDVEYVGLKNTQCIKVSAEDSLYLTDDFIVTHNSEDPRKDEAWYKRKCEHIDDPVVIAQELDLDYSASMEGVLIPAIWVQASIDAHIKLGIKPCGIRKLGLDIADEGKDKNAIGGRYGILVEYLEQWSGKDSDIYHTVEKTCARADLFDYRIVVFDSDGLGAGARGDARVINEKRNREGTSKIKFIPFRGSGSVIDPEKDPFLNDGSEKDGQKGRTNEDYFKNAKAQSWWELRRRFLNTYRAVVLGLPYNEHNIISIPRTLKDCTKLVTELSQPTYSQNNVGQIIVDKNPDGIASPNLADALMIVFSKTKKPKGFFSAKKTDDEMED